MSDNGDQEVWRKPMSNGSVAVILLNRGGSTSTVSTTASALGLGVASSYSVRDLWAHAGATAGAVSASVPAHGAAMYVVSGGAAASAIRGVGSGKCVDVLGGGQATGTAVLQLLGLSRRRQPALDAQLGRSLVAHRAAGIRVRGSSPGGRRPSRRDPRRRHCRRR
jgi:hypothetical protein